MSNTISYAAAASTPNKQEQPPRIRAKSVSNLASESPMLEPPRPKPGQRSKISWSTSKSVKKGERKHHNATSISGDVASTTPHPQSAKPFHKPNTSYDEEHVYVLTLKLTDSIAHPLTQMRERFFPKELNRTPAHLTLFHALPHSRLDIIEADLESTASCTKPFHISTGRPFRMRRGVGVGLGIGIRESQRLREQLREQWLDWLSDQDKSGWRPHWTVMNKVDDEKKVSKAFNTIRRDLFENVQDGIATGLDLWQYDNGNWIWRKGYRLREIGKTPAGTPQKMSGMIEANTGSLDLRGSPYNEIARNSSQQEGIGAWKRKASQVADVWKFLGTHRRH